MGRGGGGKDKNTQGLNSMSHRSENYPWIVYDFRLVETEDRASNCGRHSPFQALSKTERNSKRRNSSIRAKMKEVWVGSRNSLRDTSQPPLLFHSLASIVPFKIALHFIC